MTAAQDVYQARDTVSSPFLLNWGGKKKNTTFLHKQNFKQNIIFLYSSRLVQATNTNKK